MKKKKASTKTNCHVSNCGIDEGGKLRILLIGPFPDPIGGISAHIHRLSSWLSTQNIKVDIVDEAKHIKKGFYNIRCFKSLTYLRYLLKCNLAHIHSSIHIFRIFHIVMCRLFGLSVIVTIHSWRQGDLTTPINRIFLKLAHKVILVSDHINDYLKLKNYLILPAFLPPTTSRIDLPEEIKTFIDKVRARGYSLLCANAFELIKYKGQDLYGLDLCVELITYLADRSDLKVALIFIVSRNTKDNRLYANAKKVIKERKLEDRFYLYNKSVDFITLIKQSDLVLRPTNTDGDALTIREALYYGSPVIASDAVQRPPGTILFRNRDVKDLMSRTLDVLIDGTYRDCAPTQTDYDTYFKRYLDIYREVLNSRGV